MRIALAHDWLVSFRGGEAVLDRLARLLLADGHSISRIYTMFDNGARLTPVLDALPRTVAPIGRLPFASTRLRRWMLPLYPQAVGALSNALARDHAREPVDLVVSTSTAAIKGLKAPRGVTHICYCNSPARYLWAQTDQYALGRWGRLRVLGLRLFGAPLRTWDRRTAAHSDVLIANSTHIAARIRAAYGREALVIHPPVRTDYYTPADGNRPPPAREDFWLVVGAIEPYKRLDLAVAAARAANIRLVVAGGGSQLAEARKTHERPGRVEFLGRVSDEQLRDLYRRARVLIFPQEEDFGIVLVEAQACGLPAVARAAGGALDIVIPHQTGELFEGAEIAPIVDAALRITPEMSAAAAANAQRFSESRFDEAIRRVLARP
ncbi:MAG: glycosyltransferase [Phycisphaerae bacterium]|nr:glycosyltransferase [Phycisphaerae bacterium]